ncbi:fatty acid metabolism transcriptional regulator FadR, partial [Shewanella sp. GutDb-MelDb]
SADARALAMDFYKQLQQLAIDKNHADVALLMRTYGINSGIMWQSLRDKMPVELGHSNT